MPHGRRLVCEFQQPLPAWATVRHREDKEGPLGRVVGYYDDGAVLVKWEASVDAPAFETAEVVGDLRSV